MKKMISLLIILMMTIFSFNLTHANGESISVSEVNVLQYKKILETNSKDKIKKIYLKKGDMFEKEVDKIDKKNIDLKNIKNITVLKALKLIIDDIKKDNNTIHFDLHISGEDFNIAEPLKLSDVGGEDTEINFDFKNKDGKKYNFDLKNKALPQNRSFPNNLDITIKDGEGNKLGYLFWVYNKVSFLEEMGTLGLVVNIDGKPVDFKFNFTNIVKGNLHVSDLENERFVQDTLMSKHSFQMIRPVIVPSVSDTKRSITFKLDNHPYTVNYTIENLENGGVQFQHNLSEIIESNEVLLERVYYNAGSLKTLREGMYASKYFHKKDGAFKLVFYPTMGQLEPQGISASYYNFLGFTPFVKKNLTTIQKQGLVQLLEERKGAQSKFKKMLLEAKKNEILKKFLK